jgi:hypothetical protein
MDYSFNLTEITFDHQHINYYGDLEEIISIKEIQQDKIQLTEIITEKNNIFYFFQGMLNSFNDKPSIIWNEGTKMWFKLGKLHRESKPAIEWNYGEEEYFIEGKFLKKSLMKKIIIKKNIENF